ncbi:YcaO-like family protein [Sphingomicrobium sediminis]|uniref:YcaO-like family protein n=1 Tax=Sphingomicrobium sediminis TaxID=2950949 RepID=A0A9X2EJH9_9SPHN|nr:YcaO-like family protein [Sphingomicrobium sediminis]MCM8556729.1 YcaO-like family protein [Sphingomicrobium sediminis]
MNFPSDGQRAAPAAALFDAAWTAAKAAGVTRLADITRLDRIGLPVWQAVRPMSRALSVHQGKGADQDTAKLGALLEAVESDAAERFEAEGPEASWNDLPADERPDHIADLARHRDRTPPADTTHQWIAATRVDGSRLHVPLASASLDFTRFADSPFERASAGLATGSTREEAQRTALHELIERDAVSAFHAADMFERLECELDERTIPFGWFAALHGRVREAGAALRLFVLPSLTATPVIGAGVSDATKGARPYAGSVGYAAHPDPELALFQAISEALQSRLTFIAGARDDCWPWLYTEERRGIMATLAPPPAPMIDPLPFDSIEPGDRDVERLVEKLAARGFDETAFLDIAQTGPFHIVRAFCPGLGSLGKERRA